MWGGKKVVTLGQLPAFAKTDPGLRGPPLYMRSLPPPPLYLSHAHICARTHEHGHPKWERAKGETLFPLN